VVKPANKITKIRQTKVLNKHYNFITLY